MHCKKVKKVLEQGGWYEGRSIDISQQLFFLNDLGFEVFDKAIDFLKEYDQLRFPKDYSVLYKDNKAPTDFHQFNILKEVEHLYAYKGSERENGVKWATSVKRCYEKVLPVGGLYDRNIPLYITESGKIVAEVMGKTVIYGNSIEEGVENIILGKSIGAFPEPYESPERKELRKQRINEAQVYVITKLDYKNNMVQWMYDSNLYSVKVTNYIRTMSYAKSLVLIITKENLGYLYSFYSADARLIFSYFSNDTERTKAKWLDIFSHFDKNDNIRICVNNTIFTVPNLNFLAYDKRQDKLVVMAGKFPEKNKILIYDLYGNLVKQIEPTKNFYFYNAKIDSLGYIGVQCKKGNESVHYELQGMELILDILSQP